MHSYVTKQSGTTLAHVQYTSLLLQTHAESGSDFGSSPSPSLLTYAKRPSHMESEDDSGIGVKMLADHLVKVKQQYEGT